MAKGIILYKDGTYKKASEDKIRIELKERCDCIHFLMIPVLGKDIKTFIPVIPSKYLLFHHGFIRFLTSVYMQDWDMGTNDSTGVFSRKEEVGGIFEFINSLHYAYVIRGCDKVFYKEPGERLTVEYFNESVIDAVQIELYDSENNQLYKSIIAESPEARKRVIMSDEWYDVWPNSMLDPFTNLTEFIIDFQNFSDPTMDRYPLFIRMNNGYWVVDNIARSKHTYLYMLSDFNAYCIITGGDITLIGKAPVYCGTLTSLMLDDQKSGALQIWSDVEEDLKKFLSNESDIGNYIGPHCGNWSIYDEIYYKLQYTDDILGFCIWCDVILDNMRFILHTGVMELRANPAKIFAVLAVCDVGGLAVPSRSTDYRIFISGATYSSKEILHAIVSIDGYSNMKYKGGKI